jgi:hypothetical protein
MPVTRSTTQRACEKWSVAAGLAAGALGCLVLAGCSGAGSTASPTTSGMSTAVSPGSAQYSVQLCAEAAEYQTAANAIAPLDVSTAGIDGVKPALLDLQTATDNLIAVASAENQFGPQVAELEAASASLDTTVAGLGGQNGAPADIGAVTASVSAVEQAAQPMMDSLRAGCPSVPPAAIPPTS